MDIIREELAVLQPLALHPHISVSMLRLDLVHSYISGNKWYKLKGNLAAALNNGYSNLLTFGGAHSSHLLATAAAAQYAGLKSTGIVRGFHGEAIETPTLAQCRELGMTLRFISREEYAQKEHPEFLTGLAAQFPASFIIPEGGANADGRSGAGHIAKLIPPDATDVCVAIGTATTFTGLRNALPDYVRLHGFTAMKGGAYLAKEIAQYVPAALLPQCMLHTDYHFGGFAKCPPELAVFMERFEVAHGIPLDRVYNSKMIWGVEDLLSQDVFAKDARVICIHTGGLR